MPTSIGCVGIIEKEGKTLLEKRTDSDRWAFIGGGLQDDETLEQAIRREVKEETNLNVEELLLLGVVSDPSRIIQYNDGKVKRSASVVFRATIGDFSNMGKSEESTELKFFSRDEMEKIQLVETHLPIKEGWIQNT